MLDKESQEILDRRACHGERMLIQVWGRALLNDEDREAAGSDAISNIFTALFGPAGAFVNGAMKDNDEARENARRLVRRALGSYFGDAEDYFEE